MEMHTLFDICTPGCEPAHRPAAPWPVQPSPARQSSTVQYSPAQIGTGMHKHLLPAKPRTQAWARAGVAQPGSAACVGVGVGVGVQGSAATVGWWPRAQLPV